MSTPRPHEKWCKSMPREFDAAMGRGPYECDCEAEGVAAPLEPITAEKFFAEWGNKSLDRGHRDWPIKFAEAYAAAVSKNLQWKLGNEILIKE